MTSHKLLSLLPNTRLLLLLHIKRKREIVDKEWSWNYARHHVGEIASPRSDNYYVIDRPKKICCPSADNKSWNTWIGARRKPRANGDTLIHLAASVLIVVKHFHFFRHKSLVYYSIQQRYSSHRSRKDVVRTALPSKRFVGREIRSFFIT